MRIDRQARHWIFWCAVILLVATVAYIVYAKNTPGGPTGGSWPGLVYGGVGSAAMLVAILLGARKRFRWMQFGRVFYWTQAHVWLGLLSYPLILFHAGFSLGGPLTFALMVIFTIVFVTGIIGLVLQQILPQYLMREVPEETLDRQIPHVLMMIREEAESIANPIRAERESAAAEAMEASGGVATAATKSAASDPFYSFYSAQVVPFLQDKFRADSPLASDSAAETQFSLWRIQLSPDLHPAVDRLQQLVKERRQLQRQRRIHWWLHSWLILHVPLSYALLVLGTIHGIMAFRYTSRAP